MSEEQRRSEKNGRGEFEHWNYPRLIWIPAEIHRTVKGMLGVKALAFDVFGTVVDWRGSIVREGAEWAAKKGLQIDWARFADRWRAGYLPAMDKVRKGTLQWMKLDALHRMILNDLLDEFQITGLSEEAKESWNRVWHRLTPWPDSIPGLTRLKQKYVLATLSNGNVSLLVDMAKHAGLPWTPSCRQSYSITTNRIVKSIWALPTCWAASRRKS